MTNETEDGSNMEYQIRKYAQIVDALYAESSQHGQGSDLDIQTIEWFEHISSKKKIENEDRRCSCISWVALIRIRLHVEARRGPLSWKNQLFVVMIAALSWVDVFVDKLRSSILCFHASQSQ